MTPLARPAPASGTTQLVLVNLGTPTAATAEAVCVFLEEFLSDPAVVDYPRWFWEPFRRRLVLRSRPARVAELYKSIWTREGSPLRVATERIGERVRAAAPEMAVHVAYRYGEPSLDTVLRRAAASDGPIVVVPLFPQRTEPTTGTAIRKARAAAARAGADDRLIDRVMAADDAGYITALAARWNEALARAPEPEHIVMSYHGIPRRFNWSERGVYVRDCEATTRAFLRAIGWPAARATIAYQSKFGPEPWLTPATSDLFAELPRRGVRSIAAVTPGFVTEGLETLEEIGIRGEETFREAGGERFIRVGAVEDHPAFIAALAALGIDAAARAAAGGRVA